MTAYRRKLEIIDAMQFTHPDSANAITMWSKGLVVAPPVLDPQPDNPTGLIMDLPDGKRAIVGDWLIKRNGGLLDKGALFEIVKPGPFENTYVEGDAQNDLPKTVSNPLGIERRKVDTGSPERRGLGGRSNEALRVDVNRLTNENTRLLGVIGTATTSLQVLKDAT